MAATWASMMVAIVSRSVLRTLMLIFITFLEHLESHEIRNRIT